MPEQGTKSSRSCCEALLSRCKLAVHLAPFRPPGVVDRGPRRSIGGVSLLTTVDSSLPRWSRAVGCKRLAAARPTSSASNRALTCNDARALQRKYIRAQGTKPNDPTQVKPLRTITINVSGHELIAEDPLTPQAREILDALTG